MPFADPEEKLIYMQDWRARQIRRGYGKWLYQRRKLRFDDAVRFRAAAEEALALLAGRDWREERAEKGPAYAVGAINVLYNALMESEAAEEALGRFNPDSNP